jgi:hypothetical protein
MKKMKCFLKWTLNQFSFRNIMETPRDFERVLDDGHGSHECSKKMIESQIAQAKD